VAWLVLRYAALACAVAVLNFALPRLLPGDPLEALSADGIDGNIPALPAPARTAIRQMYRLDQPVSAQFVQYLADLSRGDLGWSITKPTPVRQLIWERSPITLGLTLSALGIAGAVGLTIGALSAWRAGPTARLIASACATLAALPEFLVALGLLMTLSLGVGMFPVGGIRAAGSVPAESLPAGLDVAWHLTLPVITLVVATTASFALVSRGALAAVAVSPYILVARGKGLTERTLVWRHALPNARGPILTLYAIRLGQVWGGAIAVERVFGIPGLGMLAFEAIGNRDFPILQALFLLSSLSVLLASFLVELLLWHWSARAGDYVAGA
jgi:peptide/nickel transport system permease protein